MIYRKEKIILQKINKNLKLNSNAKDKNKRDILKQQQRLILLNHANKCTDYTCCYINKICSTTRNIWEHVLCCNNNECSVTYCKTTKYILNHQYYCKDINCIICEPSREINNPIFSQMKDAANILCTIIDK